MFMYAQFLVQERVYICKTRHFNGITCTVMLCVMTACHAHFAIFSFYAHFAIFSFLKYFLRFSFQPQIVLNLFLFFRRFEPHCSY